MSDISVSVVGGSAINPTVGNGDVVNVTIANTGERGPTGQTGPANSLAIGTVTGGTNASATITGTAPSQTLNLVLPSGSPVELQSTSTYLQWRYVGGSTWTNLVALSAITGPQGPQGSGVSDTVLRALFVPPALASVTAAGVDSAAVLSWSAPSVLAQAPITDYAIQYSSDSGATWSTFSHTASTATSATVSGLTNGTAYTFRVAGVNAVGTGGYTVSSSATPAVPSDSYFSSVAVLLHMDGTGSTFTDSSGTPKTITVAGGATQSTANSKFGGKSAYFSGSTDAVSFADVALGTGDFSVELWFNTTSSVAYAQLIGNETSGSGSGFSLLINNDSSTGGQLAVYARGGGVVTSPTGTDWSDGAWHHLALSRSGSTVRLYGDGALLGTGTDSGSYTGGSWYVGSNGSYSGRNMSGYIDDVRVTKGSARGYTGSTISVPTAPFPNNA
jgi:hypothetical protein